MKREDSIMTTDELNELCHLYMDCKLSVLEEKELEYVLSRTSLTSPAIEEVRRLTEIQSLKPASTKPVVKKRFPNWWSISGIAAGVAVVLCIGLAFLHQDNPGSSVPYSCIAYVNGQEIKGDAAMELIESEQRKAEDFINRMAELDKEEQNKIEQFMNHQNDIK